ncbi:prepilin-type N-terminal cleavage/methylation domain-containing protein [Paenibacillus athensensis]|uniref:prepilin-type N-terminal cleavage/methylation domain-containing protein n=1 Tax=Paenibacillus athensensis TaxID=1967502 RepID=UPI0038B23964
MRNPVRFSCIPSFTLPSCDVLGYINFITKSRKLRQGVSDLRNQKGLTLLEVLAAVAILSGVVITVAALINSSVTSATREQRKDISVDLAKTVLEEIKRTLKNTALNSTTITTLNARPANAVINLANLRQAVSAKTDIATFAFTDSGNHTYQIIVSNMPFTGTNNTLAITDPTDSSKSLNFNIQDYFSIVQVQVTQPQLRVNYVLQSYIEKK